MKHIFYNSHGNKLVGILENPVDDANTPIMLLVHGFISSKDSQSWSLILKKLHASNIATFRIDLSAHGESDGEFKNVTITKTTNDVLQAIKYLKSLGYFQIGLLGASFGGIASIMATVESDVVSALALVCPVTDWTLSSYFQQPGLLEKWKKVGSICFEHEPGKPIISYAAFTDAKKNVAFDVASKITIPVLVVHGNQDEMVPFEGSKKFVKLLPNGKLHTIEGGLHHLRRNPKHFKEYSKVLSEFIVEQMGLV